MRRRQTPTTRVLIALVTGYRRWLSPLLGPHCRFYPSCSAYALDALRLHGAIKGSWLAVRRVGRCHPFHPGGFDPVPPGDESAYAQRSSAGSSDRSLNVRGASR